MLFGNGFGRWNTMPMRLRSSTTSRRGWYMSTPSIARSPEVVQPSTRSFMRFMQRRNVLFPQPLGPIMAVTFPRRRPIDTPFTARNLP